MRFTFEGSDFSDFLASASRAEAEVPLAAWQSADRLELQTTKGQISFQETAVNRDITILQSNYQLRDDVTIFGKGESSLLELHINLSDHPIYFENKVLRKDIAPAMSGNITFLSPQENHAKIGFARGIDYHTFDVHLPHALLFGFSGECRLMDDFLRRIEKNECAVLSEEAVKVNTKMLRCIQAIRNCAYEGLTRRIYLESKILELIAFMHEGAINGSHYLDLSSSDVERIRYAALLIRENINRPLTILDLARRIGMNQTKLKSAFKAVFNDTIFGYLQKARMGHARELLLDTDMSIQEISSLSGYNSLSNFSIAFKQTYGYPPNRLRGKA
ncbi:AraC family transcriptional regulator [Pedobacter yulinensis]|uniref:AraC family transcriptional regulator n=1 Tax=Pedobacter yulinensis TaxID=2126353 RepID=A0A2T3HR81_9SPHI|nr:AraC family transcriptional regulator [Pedobacter yulinensis]PST84952.1 AraC family transcriptional regulator [Pedobacter yulinensis]